MSSSFNYKGLDLLLVNFPSYFLVIANRTRCLLQKIYVVDSAGSDVLSAPTQSGDGGRSQQPVSWSASSFFVCHFFRPLEPVLQK